MNHLTLRTIRQLTCLSLGSIIFTACGADSSFTSNVSDLSLTSNSEFADNPCDETREGLEAIVGNDKDHYVCTFDDRDSVYVWAGESDTLTARGKKFERVESSSSVDDEDVSSSDDEEDDPSNVDEEDDSSNVDEEDDSSSSRSSKSKSSSSYSSNSKSSSKSSSSKRSSSSSLSSSSSSSSSSKTKQDIEPLLLTEGDQFNSSITYGTMTDTRDNKTYKTVTVDGVTWMAENLNYAGNAIGESVCFNEEDRFCKLYGRLYSRDAAMNSSDCAFGKSCNLGSDPIQGVCPEGWHIPTVSEAQSLVDLANFEAGPLMSAEGWLNDITPGEDVYGLSFMGTGDYVKDSEFESMGEDSYTWAYEASSNQYYLLIRGADRNTEIWYFDSYEVYNSVRCVKDDPGIIIPESSSSSSSSPRIKQNIEPILNAAGDQFNPTIEYGTLTDDRNGKTYKTVEVDGVTWMAENLNYAGNAVGESFCFNDEKRYCELYGRLYNREAAMNSNDCAFGESCNLGNGPIQGICPDGWHIPTTSEALSIVNLAKGKATPLMSAESWLDDITPGDDTYGLSFLGAGSYTSTSGTGFKNLGQYENIWVYYASTYQYYIVIRGSENESELWNFDSYELYYGIRCVKN